MPAITAAQITALNTATFTFAADVDAWTRTRLKNHYIPWFNQKLANRGAWTGVTLVDTPANQVGFHVFWNNIGALTGGTATPFQFLALMGIFANECRADFKPVAEKMGRAGFPGLTYLYDAIPGLKRSYNTLKGNKTAFQSFRNAAFNTAHGAKEPAARLRNTTDARWSGPDYPRADFPTAPDPAVAGYIMEADFMKFRGRGFIQTTGRGNYSKIIEYVQAYTGDNNVIDFYQAQWTGMSVDDIAYSTSNGDWDRLFQETDLIIAAEAIRLHNVSSGDYLALTGDPDRAILNMGKRISGGDVYAAKYRDRMESVIVQALT
ncbi:MAG: hypothetical protein ACKV2U_13690 [Bryobacteraceae bacterium]